MFAGPLGRSTFTPPKSSFDSPLYGLVSLRRSQFGRLKDYFISDQQWDAARESFFLHSGLPADPNKVPAYLKEALLHG